MRRLLIPFILLLVMLQHFLEILLGIPCSGGASHAWAFVVVPTLATYHWWPWPRVCGCKHCHEKEEPTPNP